MTLAQKRRIEKYVEKIVQKEIQERMWDKVVKNSKDKKIKINKEEEEAPRVSYSKRLKHISKVTDYYNSLTENNGRYC